MLKKQLLRALHLIVVIVDFVHEVADSVDGREALVEAGVVVGLVRAEMHLRALDGGVTATSAHGSDLGDQLNFPLLGVSSLRLRIHHINYNNISKLNT